jgi:hypothetical protein
LLAASLGIGLLKDALLRTLQAADIAGIRAIALHVKDDSARVLRTFRFQAVAHTSDAPLPSLEGHQGPDRLGVPLHKRGTKEKRFGWLLDALRSDVTEIILDSNKSKYA